MSDIGRELRHVLDTVESELARGSTAARIADLLYDEPLMMVAEGVEAPFLGFPAFLPQLEDVLKGMGPRPRLKMNLVGPILASEDVAVAFIGVECHPDLSGSPVQYYRELTGWKRGERGWRIALEMYAGTGLTLPQ